jgi:hypothetical protein
MKTLTLVRQKIKSMDIQAEKLLLIEQILRVRDVQIMEQVRELLNRENNPIVGYEADGRAITQRDFIKEIEQAEKEHESGEYQTIDELEKESEAW